MRLTFEVLIVTGVIALLGNWIGYHVAPQDGLLGLVLIVCVAMAGILLNRVIPLRAGAVVWISLLGLLITSPIFPFHQAIFKLAEEINFMALATPILAYAGISLILHGSEFKMLSWRIVIVSLLVYTGTFVFASLFAELVI